MKNAEKTPERRFDEIPGLSSLIENLRRMYPDLSDSAVCRILRLPSAQMLVTNVPKK
jgi:hypothetical protein